MCENYVWNVWWRGRAGWIRTRDYSLLALSEAIFRIIYFTMCTQFGSLHCMPFSKVQDTVNHASIWHFMHSAFEEVGTTCPTFRTPLQTSCHPTKNFNHFQQNGRDFWGLRIVSHHTNGHLHPSQIGTSSMDHLRTNSAICGLDEVPMTLDEVPMTCWW